MKQLATPATIFRSTKTLLLVIVVFNAIVNITYAATTDTPAYAPLTCDTVTQLLEHTLNSKFIPMEFTDNNGYTITLTNLNSFKMDWQSGTFTADIAFKTESTAKKLFQITPVGEATIVGVGLIAPQDQKVGIRIIKIKSLKLKGKLRLIQPIINNMLNNKLVGRESWGADAPATNTILNETNWVELLKVVIASNLPLTAENKSTAISLSHLNNLTQLNHPGQFEMELVIQGKYKGIVKIGLEGTINLAVEVQVIPEQLCGLIRIKEVKAIDIKNIPDALNGIIKHLANEKFGDKEWYFDWK